MPVSMGLFDLGSHGRASMRSPAIGIAILIIATTAGYSADTCDHSYSVCVARTKDLGLAYEKQCKEALTRARKTGIFIGPHTGTSHPCTP
jgi:hypothetical protein